MKRAAKDCWVLKQWPWIIFLTTALLTLCMPATAATASALHIASAQLLNIPGQGFSAPPQVVNEQLLPDKWTTVILPHALTRHAPHATFCPAAVEGCHDASQIVGRDGR